MKLHLGCGRTKRAGFIGVDIVDVEGVDTVHDLTVFPYPFAADSVDEVLMRNVLEHLPNTLKVMEEIWRVCSNGARIEICVPYYNSHCASTDPTHVKYFSENTFDYFTVDGAANYSFYNYYTHARFQICKIEAVQRRIFHLLPRRLSVVHRTPFVDRSLPRSCSHGSKAVIR